MKVDVRYFASLRESLGPQEWIELDDGASVAALRDLLIALGGEHASALARDRLVRAARNRALVAESVVLADGDEVGFFPPVTGG